MSHLVGTNDRLRCQFQDLDFLLLGGSSLGETKQGSKVFPNCWWIKVGLIMANWICPEVKVTLPPIIMVQWKMGVSPILVSFHLG